MNIKLVSLQNGEMVLADVEEKETTVTLTQPMVLSISQAGVGFNKWPMFSRNDTTEVDKSKIMYITEVVEGLEQAYIEQVGGIVVPKKELIL
jgi:hypothetical protein